MLKKTLILEDGSTLNDLKKGNVLVWISFIFLSTFFLLIFLMFLYYTIFGLLSNMNAPETLRIFFGLCAIFLLNIYLTTGFNKPIKIYKEGIDLGSTGSLGWIFLIFGFIFYFKKTTLIEWKNINKVIFGFNINNKRIIKVIDFNQKIFYCTLYDDEKSCNNILSAIKKIGRGDRITYYETKN